MRRVVSAGQFLRLLLALLLTSTVAHAASGRLIATGGASRVEGTAGGGLVPWAVLSGYGTVDETGATAFYTRVGLPDYRLDGWGAAFTWHNALELTVARNRFDLGTLVKALGMPGAALRQNVLGAKPRLFGDVIYGDLPQVSLGVQRKIDLDFDVPRLVGAQHASGTDLTLSATRVVLAGAAGYNLLLNVTARYSNANQFGLIGFGGDRGGHHLLGEGSVAVLFNPRLALGAEYRQKSNNLAFAREDDAHNVFVAWFPSKHVSLVAAFASLGSIAGLRGQQGWYVSLQAAF